MKNVLKLVSLVLIISPLLKAQESITSIVDRPKKDVTSTNYTVQKAPLLPELFIKLPVGKIKPKGWLSKYLELQRDGLTGHLGEISAWLDKDNNAWLNNGGDAGWEEVPYWLKGYGNIAYILEDPKMLAETQTWIEAVFKSQQSDGYFGPINDRGGKRELWANMIMLWCLQSYYEYSADQRVIDLMTKYFKWQMTVPDEQFLKDYWENSRGGDNMHSVYWLYNITGDAFLLELVEKLHRNTANWMQSTSLPNWHNVNIAQGFREPATYYMMTKDSTHLRASYNVHQLIRRTFGQVSGGMFGADENARLGYIDPRQGTETCGWVEQMASDEIMLRYTGDPLWADHCENIAFNSYPASVMPDFKSLRYITSPNHVMSDSKNHHPGIDNSGPFLAMNPFSSRCCQHNHTQGWPYFIENLIYATHDNGVAAVIYGANEASIKVANGIPIKVVEETNYPFEETIKFRIETSQPVSFPFYLRIPSWTENAEIAINGKKVKQTLTPDKYLLVDREWKNGDIITLRFPMTIDIKRWQVNQNSASVNYGPLTFSLDIKEEYRKVNSSETAIGDSRWQKNADPQKWPSYEIYPASAWNYALVLDNGKPLTNFVVEKRAWPTDNFPFIQSNAPIVIKAKGRKIPSWKIDEHGLCGVLPHQDAKIDKNVEEIKLVPMGSARLRITSFPVTNK